MDVSEVCDGAEKSASAGNYWVFELSGKCDKKYIGLCKDGVLIMFKNKSGARRNRKVLSIFVLPERTGNNRQT